MGHKKKRNVSLVKVLREAGEPPSLQTVKACLDKALGDLIFEISPVVSRGQNKTSISIWTFTECVCEGPQL